MSVLSLQNLEALWIEAGGPSNAAPQAAAVAMAESGGNPLAINPTDNNGTQTSWGLWQISDGTHNEITGWSDPLTNAKLAVQKYMNAGGTFARDWGTYGGATYNANLPSAYTDLPSVISNIGAFLSGTNGATAQSNTTPSTGQILQNWNPFTGQFWSRLNPLVPSNYDTTNGNLFGAKMMGPLIVGIGILFIGIAVILSNHSTDIIAAGKTAAETGA